MCSACAALAVVEPACAVVKLAVKVLTTGVTTKSATFRPSSEPPKLSSSTLPLQKLTVALPAKPPPILVLSPCSMAVTTVCTWAWVMLASMAVLVCD